MCLNDKGQYMYDEGAKMISELIKVNSTLRILDLSVNTIGDEGTIMISESLKTNTTLTDLSLGCYF